MSIKYQSRGMPVLFVVMLICVSDIFAGNNNRPADHVVLISIDGFRSAFYQNKKMPSPMLQYMAKHGVQADGARGIFPSLTYPSHTTLVTGSFPAKHGIYYNTPFEPEGQTGRWYWEYDAITSETIWSLASDNNLVTASIGWPVTVDAPIDYNLPEIWDPQGEWVAAVRRHTTPEGYFEEIEMYATGKMSGDMLSGQHLTREDRVGAIAGHMLQEQKPNLLTIHLVTTDFHQHRYGMDHYLVERAIAVVDRAIARMVEAADNAGILDRTAFVISGDHGFTNVSARVAPNVWLVEAGLMEDREDRGNWRATFHASGGVAFLHLRDPDDHEAAQNAREIIESQPASVQRLFRIVDRDELDAIGANPDVPFALTASEIAGMSSARSGNAVRSGSGGTHGHFPDFSNMETGFVAWGSGIRESVHATQIGMEDIAPMVARLLGLELKDADGIVIPGFLE